MDRHAFCQPLLLCHMSLCCSDVPVALNLASTKQIWNNLKLRPGFDLSTLDFPLRCLFPVISCSQILYNPHEMFCHFISLPWILDFELVKLVKSHFKVGALSVLCRCQWLSSHPGVIQACDLLLATVNRSAGAKCRNRQIRSWPRSQSQTSFGLWLHRKNYSRVSTRLWNNYFWNNFPGIISSRGRYTTMHVGILEIMIPPSTDPGIIRSWNNFLQFKTS